MKNSLNSEFVSCLFSQLKMGCVALLAMLDSLEVIYHLCRLSHVLIKEQRGLPKILHELTKYR